MENSNSQPLSTTPHQGAQNPFWSRIIDISYNPAALQRLVTLLVGIAIAVAYGWMVGSGESEMLILTTVWLGAILIIVLVRDYWWAPLILISALTFRTYALGFAVTGLELGIIVLALTFPVKLAMRTLQVAKPVLHLGRAYWFLLGFVALHACIIILYSRIEGVPLKNIIKAYYAALSPLVFYGLLMRYCHSRTVKPVSIAMFCVYFLVMCICIPVIIFDIRVPFLSELHILLDWAYSETAIGTARSYAPMLFTAALAFWPTRRIWVKILLLLAIVVAMFGGLVSGGRIVAATCVVASILICMIRRKAWATIPILGAVAMLSLFITTNPDSLFHLPVMIQRALTPLNLSEHPTEAQLTTLGSDAWHEELRRESLDYWTSDVASFWIGHGFKAWDETLSFDPDWTRFYEDAKRLAIQMGRTENTFSSLTNIFGLTGLLFYAWFMGSLTLQIWHARRHCPQGSYARSLCEFSLVLALIFVIFAPFAGGTPGINLIYWQLGLLAARPYLADASAVEEKHESSQHPRNRGVRKSLAGSRRARSLFLPR